jgi:hypothetical protein
MSKSKHGFSAIALRKNFRLRPLKLLRHPSDIKSEGAPSPLCSPRSDVTWQHPHQQWASQGNARPLAAQTKMDPLQW